MQKTIGILDFQGGVALHAAKIAALGATVCYVKTSTDLQECEALIMPGGESTTMLKFLFANGLFDAIKNFAASGKKIFGTCAGAILLAQKVLLPEQKSLGLINIAVERNSYGRQINSGIFKGDNLVAGTVEELVFIRAPRIIKINTEVEVLARFGTEAVAVQQNNILVTTFHPELSTTFFWHEWLVGCWAINQL